MKTYKITIKGKEYEVVVGDIASSPVNVTVNGEEFQIDLPDKASSPSAAASRPPAARPTRTVPASAPRPAVPASGGGASVLALMPGRIVSISVSVGQTVAAGQAVLVMESMKMENTISAVADGSVTAVLVAEGDSVQHGQTLIEIEPQ